MTDRVQQLIQQAWVARQEHRFDDARRLLTEAVAHGRASSARASSDRQELAVALTRLGAIERDTRHFDLALTHYLEAVSLYRETNDTLRLAHSIRHVGDVHYDAQHPDLAAPCYREALALYRAHSDPPPLDLANAVRGFAVLKDDAGDREQARLLWIEARDLYASLSIEAGVAEATRRIDKDLQLP